MAAPTIPTKIVEPFATNAPAALIQIPIPLISSTPGRASFDAGFPQLNFDPVASGGIPPFGADFNGLLNQITAWLRWAAAGGYIQYDNAFATSANVNGYPIMSVLDRANGGWWLNLVDGNTTDPDAGGANWQLISTGDVVTINAVGAAIDLTPGNSNVDYVVKANRQFNLPTASAVNNGVSFGFNCRGGTAAIRPDPADSIAGGPAGQTYTFPDGTGGLIIRDDTGNWALFYFSGPGTGIYTTATLVLLPGNTYLLDSTAGPFTLTLPPFSTGPAVIVVQDVGKALNSNPVTLMRNGGTGNIMGIAQDCLLHLSGVGVTISNDGNGPNWSFA